MLSRQNAYLIIANIIREDRIKIGQNTLDNHFKRTTANKMAVRIEHAQCPWILFAKAAESKGVVNHIETNMNGIGPDLIFHLWHLIISYDI
jgi:hypothetical protein